MSGFVLNEYQGACRAAHQQAQLVAHMYERLLQHAGLGNVAAYRADERHRELQRLRALLEAFLARENLLPTKPDPEKEELLELFTGLREAFGADERLAVTERLISEEYGLLRLGERMQEASHAGEIDTALAETRAAIARLERLEGAASG